MISYLSVSLSVSLCLSHFSLSLSLSLSLSTVLLFIISQTHTKCTSILFSTAHLLSILISLSFSTMNSFMISIDFPVVKMSCSAILVKTKKDTCCILLLVDIGQLCFWSGFFVPFCFSLASFCMVFNSLYSSRCDYVVKDRYAKLMINYSIATCIGYMYKLHAWCPSLPLSQSFWERHHEGPIQKPFTGSHSLSKQETDEQLK